MSCGRDNSVGTAQPVQRLVKRQKGQSSSPVLSPIVKTGPGALPAYPTGTGEEEGLFRRVKRLRRAADR
jgi:hypothetical protein